MELPLVLLLSLVAIAVTVRHYRLVMLRKNTDLARPKALFASQASLLHSVLDNISDGVIVADPDGKPLMCNRAAETLLGASLTQTSAERWSEKWGIYFPDGLIPFPSNELPLVKAIRGEETSEVELLFRNVQSASAKMISLTGRPLKDEDGKLLGGIALLRDITERWEMEQRVADTLQLNQEVIATSSLGIGVYRKTGDCVLANGALATILGGSPEKVQRQNMYRLKAWKSSGLQKAALDALSSGNETRLDVHTVSDFGKEVWLDCRVIRLTTSKGPHVLMVIDDIAQRKRAEEKLWHMSMYDSLTGLYNRTFFDEEVARLERGRLLPISVVMIDLNNLKLVNDHLGHPAGDELLRQTAVVMKAVFRTEDVIARIGGDEFAVLLPETSASVLEQIVERIKNELKTFNASHTEIPLSVSIGTATADRASQLREVLKQADQDMYEQKQRLRA